MGLLTAFFTSRADPAVSANTYHFRVVHDFRDSWRFYSEKDQTLLPYIPENDVQTNTVYFRVDPVNFPGEDLVLVMPAGTSIWVEHQLIRINTVSDTVYFSMDSLADAYDHTVLNMAVYRPGRTVSGFLAFAGNEIKSSTDDFQVYPVSKRNQQPDKDVFIILGLVILVFFTVLFNIYPKDARLLFNVSFVLARSTTAEETFKPRTITKAQVLFILALSSLISFLLLVLHKEIGIIRMDKWMGNTPIPIAWLILSGAFFLLINLKYILILFMSRLFSIEDKAHHYFFDIFILSMVFYSVLFLVLAAAGLAFPYKMEVLLAGMIYAVIAFYLSRVLLMFLKISNRTAVKNLHLFSYLCTTELLPVIVGIKYFLE